MLQNKNKYYLLLLFIGLVSIHCSGPFLSSSYVNSFKNNMRGRSKFLFYDKEIAVTKNEKMLETVHSIYYVGENANAIPDIFYVYDGSIEKLVDVNFKIIKSNGSERKFNKRNMEWVNLSNQHIVSKSGAYFLSLSTELNSGDLIEMVSVHEHELGFLGSRFSLSDFDFAQNVSCTYKLPNDYKLIYKVKNDNLNPTISNIDGKKVYKFMWDEYGLIENQDLLSKNNVSPILLAQIVKQKEGSKTNLNINSWQDFGNVFLEKIKNKIDIENAEFLAMEITKGLQSDKEKMDAISEYCQKNIRYEQVYLEHGEIIPNEYRSIVERKFGDCKDYSIAMYTLAKSIGLQPHLALCYRGRGKEFYPDIPVTQFNHMILHYQNDTNHVWYDGTNRTGKSGVVSRDLINQTALVIEKNNSRLIKIEESSENNLEIVADLSSIKNKLKGEIKIKLSSQFAIDMLFAQLYLTEERMLDYLKEWCNRTLNKDIVIKTMKWHSEESEFCILLNCEIPSSIVQIDKYCYTNLSRIFPELFPTEVHIEDTKSLFYFPGYNNVTMNLNIRNLFLVDQDFSENDKSYRYKYEYYLNPGPLSEFEKVDFEKGYNTTRNEFLRNKKFIQRGL